MTTLMKRMAPNPTQLAGRLRRPLASRGLPRPDSADGYSEFGRGGGLTRPYPVASP